MPMIKLATSVLLCFALAACVKLGGDYDHIRPERFWKLHPELNDPTTERAAEALAVEDQYAIYRYSMEYFRPGRFLYMPLVKRGGAALPLVRTKLESLSDGWAIWNIAIVLEAMKERGVNIDADPRMAAALQAASARCHGPYCEEVRAIAAHLATVS